MEAADRARRVAERVGPFVPVRGGVGGVAHPPRIADHDEDPGHRGAAQPDTTFCLQSMHSIAHGSASSRSGPIGFPHRSHVP